MSKLAKFEAEIELIELPDEMDEEAFIDYASYQPDEFGYIFVSGGVLVHKTDAEKARAVVKAFEEA